MKAAKADQWYLFGCHADPPASILGVSDMQQKWSCNWWLAGKGPLGVVYIRDVCHDIIVHQDLPCHPRRAQLFTRQPPLKLHSTEPARSQIFFFLLIDREKIKFFYKLSVISRMVGITDWVTVIIWYLNMPFPKNYGPTSFLPLCKHNPTKQKINSVLLLFHMRNALNRIPTFTVHWPM